MAKRNPISKADLTKRLAALQNAQKAAPRGSNTQVIKTYVAQDNFDYLQFTIDLIENGGELHEDGIKNAQKRRDGAPSVLTAVRGDGWLATVYRTGKVVVTGQLPIDVPDALVEINR